jgi:hypothetical protein
MLKLNVPLKRCTVQVEAETQRQLFEEYAAAVEVFGERRCGLCKSEAIVPVVRSVVHGKQEYAFHELHCLSPECRARLSFGVHKGGNTLFPHRRLDAAGRPDRASGAWGEHRGWTKYRGEPKSEAAADGRTTAIPTTVPPVFPAKRNGYSPATDTGYTNDEIPF